MSREIRIGLLAVVAIAGFVWGYKFLLGNNILQRSNTYLVEYDNIDDLKVSNPVSINGFQIGVVQDIYLKPEDLQTIVVVLNIKGDIQLPKNTIAELRSSSVMGGRIINLEYDGICRDNCLPSGSYLQGKAFGLLGSLVNPSELDSYVKSVQDGVGGVVDSLNAHLGGEATNEIGKTFKSLQQTIANLNATTAQINHLFANSSTKLVGILENLESVTNNLQNNNEDVAGLLKNVNEVTSQLASARLDTTILRSNRTLGSTQKTLGSLQETLDKADQTFAQLTQLLADINKGEGTLGGLAKDQALYDNLTSLTKNLDFLLQDVRINPKRYINVSVFGKKQKKYEKIEDDPAHEGTTEGTSN